MASTSGARLREVNKVAVLALIGRQGPISRADIARRLGLSPPAVTAVTRALLDAGIIHKTEDAEPRGGRPGELLAVVGKAAVAIGVKVASGRLTGVRADLDGTILSSFEAPFDEAVANPFESLAELLAPHLGGPQPLLGIGLGVPGFVDSATDLVQAPLLGWRRMPLGGYLSQLLDLPVLVDNDVNTLAAYEHLYGLGRPYEDFLTVTLGRGVGAAVVIGGDLRRGGHGAAGELGHITQDPAGRRCHCGKNGCLETYLSDDALVRQACEAGIVAAGEGADELRAAADRGDTAALELYNVAGQRLGAVLGAVSVMLDPQAVLVSGEGSRAWPHLSEGFFKTFFPGTHLELGERINVHIDPWDDAKWALGAAALVLRAPFTHTLETGSDAVRARFPGMTAGVAP